MMVMTYGDIDKSKNTVTLTFTKGEALFITESLKRLRSDIRQAIEEHGDDDGGYDAHIRMLDKIILKFA
jgi:hypothetical protein